MVHTRCEEGAIDQETIEQGVKLTLLGMGTAFGLLLLLTLLIVLMGRIVSLTSRGPAQGEASASDRPATDARDRAVAAVVAVTAMMEKDNGNDKADSAGG